MPSSWYTNPDQNELLASAEWTLCEDRIRAFEQAWREGRSPDIGDYLCDSPAARRALLIELVCTDLEYRLKAGAQARLESYLAKYPELAGDRRAALELIEAEYDLRRSHHENVRLDEYRDRFPHFVEDLTTRIPSHKCDTQAPTATAAASPSPVWPDVPGYEIVGEIGRGGMGIIYKARETSLGRFVALKFLPAEVAGDADRMERFVREARTASALNHPHICVVHALGKHANHPFIVMEFIEGETLHAQIARRPSVDQVVRWVAQATRALAAAHAAGIVHRDIKPENLMVRGDGYLKVLDFGLARRPPQLADSTAAAMRDTDPGTIFGTFGYMSPEQALGQTAEKASDIFSLGIVLYELATGQHPFRSESPLGMAQAIARQQPPSPARLNPEIPVALAGLIEAMLQKDARLRPTALEVEATLASLASAAIRAAPSEPRKRLIVHREPELAALYAALERAEAGRGELVCIAGEPGIGKTTLVEDFLASPGVAAGNCLVARGQCSERLGGAEAYMPVIDALQDLLRAHTSGTVARLMAAVAPTWYGQVAAAKREILRPNAAEGAVAFSQPALLRELRALLEEVSRLRPVILFFDDVHWSDVSTVDLIAHLGRHFPTLRVLVIVSYRPTELLLGQHPFHGVKLELQTRGVCTELALGFLSRPDLDRYLTLAFPAHAIPADFADLVYSRTEGNPLFVVELLRYLRDRGAIAEQAGHWCLARDLPDLLQELPDSIRSMIERKLARLGEADLRLLGAASVQGPEFDSAVLAEAVRLEAEDVDDRLQFLDRVHGLIRPLGAYEFPDRTLTLRYAFVHALYQQALYGGLPPTRKAAFAAGLAQALARRHAKDSTEAAAALACLYEEGRDFASAARQFWLAGQNAARVFAHREAVALARRGLHLLEALPETAERAALELPLQTMLGLQLQVTEGFAAPDARLAYCRARVLCERGAAPASLFPVLWGLWLFSKVRSELNRAQEMAGELLDLSKHAQDSDLELQAHQAMGMTGFCRGDPAAAVRHVEQATALYDPPRHQTHSFLFGQDPAVICQAFGAVALWLLGYPERAKRQSDATLQMSRTLSPSSQAVALHFAAMLHQLRRDVRRTGELAAAASALAVEHGFSFWRAGASVLGGWATSAGGAVESGAEQLRGGLIDWLATDSVTYQTYYLGLLAEVLGAQGKVREPLRLLEEALALAEQTGEGLYEAELYRLRGEFRLRAKSAAQAEADFRKALDIARRQKANSLKLRAAMSLTRLYREQARQAEARPILAESYNSFTEGLDTADLQEAKVLLEQTA